MTKVYKTSSAAETIALGEEIGRRLKGGFGFGTLVGVFYPICGYLGIPFVVMLFLNWKSAKKK